MTNFRDTAHFTNPQAPGFGTVTPADECLHPSDREWCDDAALVETQFLGFNVPEADLLAMNYSWVHPNLEIISGGPWAWTGRKRQAPAAELCDIRVYTPFRHADLDDYTLPSGYKVAVVRPLEQIRISYTDEARRNAFDVTLTAVMPPAGLPSARHFTQAMKTEGNISLRGRHHLVDGFTVRDRSWGEVRSEAPHSLPPVHWLTGVFGERLAFHVNLIEDVKFDPIWRATFPEAEEAAAINRGWVWRDGELRHLVAISLRTEWDLTTGHPVRHRLEATDSEGQTFHATGSPGATNWWPAYTNVIVPISLFTWEAEGHVGWGDGMTVMWTDFLNGVLS